MFRFFRTRTSVRRTTPASPRRAPPWLEVLEDRCTPTTVTNLMNSGPGSLRQAIQSANSLPGPDLIQFNIPGTGVHTIVAGSDLPFVTELISGGVTIAEIQDVMRQAETSVAPGQPFPPLGD